MNRHRFHIMALIAILIVAATLRLNHITQPFNDAISWRQTSVAMIAENFYRKSWNIFYPEVNWSGAGPSYQGREFQTVSYIAALLYLLIGQHDWVGRSVAVVFGVWGIFALYQLVRRVWDEEHALATAAVMALLPGSIFTDRSFIPDPAMVALVITSFWMLVAYLQTDRLRYLLLMVAIGTWGLLTKIPGLIIGLPMCYAVFAILGRRRMLDTRKLALIGAAGLTVLAPVIAYYLWARHLALAYPPHHFAGAGHWIWDDGLQAWLSEDYFLPRLRQRLSVWTWTKPVVALACLGLLLPPRGKRDGDAEPSQDSSVGAPWVFHWWLIAGVTFYVIGAEELIKNPWNFHIISPAVAALAAHAILLIASAVAWAVRSPALSRIPLVKSLRLQWLAVGLLLAIVGWYGQSQLQWLYYPYADESYKLGLALHDVTQPGDLVVTVANDIGDPSAIYYSQRRGWVFPPAGYDIIWTDLPEDDDEAIQLFEQLRATGARWFGVVNAHEQELRQDHQKLADYISSTCELKSESDEWAIYRILTPDELARLAAHR